MVESGKAASVPDFLHLAREAASQTQTELVEGRYRELLQGLKSLFGDNQREIAAELQKLARALEAHVGYEQAMNFKQKTCELLLRISMEERMQQRQSAASAPAALETLPERQRAESAFIFGSLDYLVCGVADPDAALNFYLRDFAGRALKVSTKGGKKSILLQLCYGPELILTNSVKSNNFMPVFRVSPEQADKLFGEALRAQQNIINTPLGEAREVCDLAGNRFAVVVVDSQSETSSTVTDAESSWQPYK